MFQKNRRNKRPLAEKPDDGFDIEEQIRIYL
jgi:hypothetical protein